MRRNIKLLIEYDGTNYIGWQRQPVHHGNTIQAIIENSLRKMVHHEVNLIPSGRTDAGVHAQGQVANFFTLSSIPVEKFPRALKGLLPQDIVVKGAWEIDENFHARYSVLEKTYRYIIRTSIESSAFDWRYCTHLPIKLDLKKMNIAADLLVGTNDFTSFCAKGSPVKNFIRTIKSFNIFSDENKIYFQVTANGFLYHMVRIMVGTLVEVGRGRWDPEYIN